MKNKRLPSFKEVAIKYSPRQTSMINDLTESSPLLSRISMMPSSDGFCHKPKVSIRQTYLNLIQGIIEVGEDKANTYKGGLNKYIADKLSSILRKTGNDVETTLFYNNLRSYAKRNSKLIDSGGTNNENYSAVCVAFKEDELCGLYPEEEYNKNVLDCTWVGSKTKPHVLTTGIKGFGYTIKSHFGMLLNNPQLISGICNIDLVQNKVPTKAMLDQMVTDASATVDDSIIVCRPEVVTKLDELYGRGDTWGGIPFIRSRNLLTGNEPNVSI